MIFGYHADGLPGIPPDRAAVLLDEVGFGSIALSVRRQFFDPSKPDCQKRVDALAGVLRQCNLSSVLEVESCRPKSEQGRAGAAQVSRPSLISADLEERDHYIKLCEYAIDIAATLRSDCVVLRSGAFTLSGEGEEDSEDTHDAAWERLEGSLLELLDYAEARAIPIGFEPSVGMLVDTTDALSRLFGQVSSGMLRLSLDLATLYFMGETPLAHFLHTWAGQMVNLFLCDVKDAAPNRRLMLGEGELEFPPLFVALDEAGYSGGVHVRMDSPSGEGDEQMQQAMRFLRQAARFSL